MRPTERGGRLIGTGIILMALTPVIVAVGAVWGFSRSADPFLAVPDGGTYSAFGHETIRISAQLDGAAGDGSVSSVTCRAHLGDHLVFEGRADGSASIEDGRRYVQAGSVKVPSDGAYRLTCGGHPVGVERTDGYLMHLFGSTMLGGFLGVLTAVVLGLAGLVVLIIGTSRRRRSRELVMQWDRSHRPMPGSGHERYPGGPRVPPAYLNPPDDPFRAPPS